MQNMKKMRFMFLLVLMLQLAVLPMTSFAAAAEQSPKINYVALGDSLAAGMDSNGVDRQQGFVDFLSESLQQKGLLEASNKGFAVSGYTTAQVLADINANVVKSRDGIGTAEELEIQTAIKDANLITLTAGANDVLKHVEIDSTTGQVEVDPVVIGAEMQKVGENIGRILATIKALNSEATVLVMGYYNPYPHVGESLQPQLNYLVSNMNKAIEAGMQGSNAIFVPTADKIKENYKLYLPNPANIHLSEEGYQAVAQVFEKKIMELASEVKPPSRFTDIEGHWGADVIEQAAALEVLKGYDDGTFKPDNKLTRAQAAAIITRTLGLTATEQAPFADITKYKQETQNEIAAAYQFGIIKGYGNQFKPGQEVTRSQFSLMIYRAYTEVLKGEYDMKKVAPFTDIAKYDAETQKAITFLYDHKIAEGSNGLFKPGGFTTRAHAAKMIVNFAGKVPTPKAVAIN